MKISIIIPIYKVRDYIVDCLSSIIKQNVDESLYEVILVNDGTPDDSMEIASPFIEKINNIKIINQKNQGLSVARNNGFSLAEGEYIWFVDSDDWLLQDALINVFRAIEENPNCPVFSSRLLMNFEDGRQPKTEFNPTIFQLSGKDYLRLGYKQGAVQRFIFKKDFLLKYNLHFFPGILHEDGLFGIQMLYLTPKVCILQNPVYAYRIRTSGSIMSSVSVRSANDMLFIHKELRKFQLARVDKLDQPWFQLRLAFLIKDLYFFSRNIIRTKEFLSFYEENKLYLKEESKVLLHTKNNFWTGLYLSYFPIQWYSIRSLLKKYINEYFKI